MYKKPMHYKSDMVNNAGLVFDKGVGVIVMQKSKPSTLSVITL